MITATLLGCGSSGGVPRIGNIWGACDPKNPKNRRTRCSLLVETAHVRFLIDTAPDVRTQLLRENVATVDGIAFTHDHADQSGGLDDMRAVYQNRGEKVIPVWLYRETAETLMKRFAYCFEENAQRYPVIFSATILESPHAIFEVAQTLHVETFPLEHGPLTALGFKIKNPTDGRTLAYMPDVHSIPPSSCATLNGVDVWIVDCLGYHPHPTHAHLDQVLEWVTLFKPTQTILTNLHITMDYETLIQKLPSNICPGFDGLKIAL